MGRSEEFEAGRGVELRYHPPVGNTATHAVTAWVGEKRVGVLRWKPEGEIERIAVEPEFRRQGIATAMWHHGHANSPVPPVHSKERSPSGEGWARAVGGKLPERTLNQLDPEYWERYYGRS